ncbi:Protein CBG16931 [Caenorhabditis briggsae]|uniref:Protein CBG16931 n=1 Tax=Caenorhabditis briggsae TaxID=6238 RepID=A8XQ31_CAEBR|nr:Protein CBG16931 [Caenorhabditis briggsae]CAP34757.1 Protein CBG16931 [Caenorhabditis briggsae]
MQTVGESQRKKSEPATVKKKKTPGEEREIEFWRERGTELLKRSIVEIEPEFDLFLYTDASARGIGARLERSDGSEESNFNYEPGSDADILMCRWRLRTKGKCPYVFSHLDGSKKLSKQAISTLSTKMLAAIGKPGATHHCFRRGGANNMRRIGHSMEEIQCRGRWRSAAGLQRYLTDVPIAQGCLQSQAESDDEEK